jgi:hypothetical protein
VSGFERSVPEYNDNCRSCAVRKADAHRCETRARLETAAEELAHSVRCLDESPSREIEELRRAIEAYEECHGRKP